MRGVLFLLSNLLTYGVKCDKIHTIKDRVLSPVTSVEYCQAQMENKTKKDEQLNNEAFEFECPKKPVYEFFKRFFDLLFSGLAIILLSWLILILLLIKWLEDFKNPIYVSTRIGKDGKPIKFHKIRTMCVDAEQLKGDYIREGMNEADGPVFKIKDDPRITKVGKVYRKFSMDELLQLFDIFMGRMSIVGPRPPLPEEVELYNSKQLHRLDIKGGLLCLWQIQKNRHDLAFDEWVNLDLEYIRNRSLWLDLKIIFVGAWMVVFDHSGE